MGLRSRRESISVHLLLVLLVGGGCSSTDESRVRDRIAHSGHTATENSAKVADIARRLEAAYRSCSTLAFTAQVVEPPNHYQVRVELAMSPNRLKTKAFVDDVPIVIWTLIDGQFEECKLRYKGTPAEYSIRKAERSDGPDDVTLAKGIERHMCGLGAYYRTWLGKNTSRMEYFTDRIRGGSWIATETVDGFPCDVIASLPNECYGGTELFYVRPDGFVAKWESIRPAGSKTPRLARIRTYTNYHRDALRTDTWRFEKPPASFEEH